MARLSYLAHDGPVTATSQRELTGAHRMAFLYALGHGANLSDACIYARMTPAALLEEFDRELALSRTGQASNATTRFAKLVRVAFRVCQRRQLSGPLPLAALGLGTLYTHADYVRQLRESQDSRTYFLHDEHYLDD